MVRPRPSIRPAVTGSSTTGNDPTSASVAGLFTATSSTSPPPLMCTDALRGPAFGRAVRIHARSRRGGQADSAGSPSDGRRTSPERPFCRSSPHSPWVAARPGSRGWAGRGRQTARPPRAAPHGVLNRPRAVGPMSGRWWPHTPPAGTTPRRPPPGGAAPRGGSLARAVMSGAGGGVSSSAILFVVSSSRPDNPQRRRLQDGFDIESEISQRREMSSQDLVRLAQRGAQPHQTGEDAPEATTPGSSRPRRWAISTRATNSGTLLVAPLWRERGHRPGHREGWTAETMAGHGYRFEGAGAVGAFTP